MTKRAAPDMAGNPNLGGSRVRGSLRIYSFTPSGTEMVYALGLDDPLAGVTHECDYPRRPAASRGDQAAHGHGEHEPARDRRHRRGSMAHGHGLYSIDKSSCVRASPTSYHPGACDVCWVSSDALLSPPSPTSRESARWSLTRQGAFSALDDILTVGKACGAPPLPLEKPQ